MVRRSLPFDGCVGQFGYTGGSSLNFRPSPSLKHQSAKESLHNPGEIVWHDGANTVM